MTGYISLRKRGINNEHNGKDSKDVADIMIYGTKVDRVEFVFEP